MTIFGFRLTRLRVFIIALIVSVAIGNPSVRRILWWLLPLGSGRDDIIEMIALAIMAIVLFVEIWTNLKPRNPYN